MNSVSSKNRTGFLARDSVKSVVIKLPPIGTQVNSGQEPKLHRKPAGGETGPKKAQFSSGAVIGSIKPAERRDATRAAADNQGEGEVAESLNLVREQPLARPELALSQAFQLLKNEDWEKKIDGLMLVRSLAQNHADILLPKLRDVCFAVVEEVKNLRSMVSCAAMTTLAHLFANLRRAMDPEAEAAARVLLHKAGDSSLFIREDVDLALDAMVQSCSPRRVIHALLAGGLRHKNSAVRKTTALHLQRLALLLGASRLLTGKKDLTESFLTAISRLALDAAQEVRFYARSCITLLSSHKDIIKMVDKCVPPKERSSIKDIILKSR
ncbi:TOG array regulator of axonemal microtubules protein 1-like isoform X2 [Brachyhypopomus gauderio]